jgi:hypothetical protein
VPTGIGAFMSILSAVSSSAGNTGIRVVLAGVEKVGKTTLATNAPRPLLIPLETGYSGVVVNKVPMLERLEFVMQLLDEIEVQCQQGIFPYKTLVFDSGTALERLIHTSVLESDPSFVAGNKKAATMESALGGFGRAYTYANQLFDIFLKKCDVLAVQHGLNIVITCHVFSAKIVDPTVGEYDCWDLLLHSPKNQKTYGKREAITQWADVIGFLHEPMFIIEGTKINKGVSANKGRILSTNRTPAYVAGNRFGITTDIPLPKDGGWNHLANAIYVSSGVDVFNRD